MDPLSSNPFNQQQQQQQQQSSTTTTIAAHQQHQQHQQQHPHHHHHHPHYQQHHFQQSQFSPLVSSQSYIKSNYPISPTHLHHTNTNTNQTANQHWPTSPLLKPHSVGTTGTDPQTQSVIWPTRSSIITQSQTNHQISNQSLYHQTHLNSSLTPTSTTSQQQRFSPNPQLNREPRSPTREDHRRPSPLDQSLTSAHLPHPNSNPNHPTVNPNQIKSKEPHTKIRVSNIERNRRDLYIKFDAWSNLITNRSGHCPNISRSYREFLLFYEAISANNPHTIVPPIPFPNTSAPNPADDDRLVASAFQQFFDRLLQDPSLRTDDELRLFLESDFGYTPQTKSKRKLTSTHTGFTSFNPLSSNRSNSLPPGRTLSSATVNGTTGGPETIVSIVEEDELSNARLQFRLLEERLGNVVTRVESLARVTRSLSAAHQELSNKFISFSTTESHASLSTGFKKLGDSLRNLSVAETGLAIGSLVTIADGLGWCSVESKAGKEVLKNRAAILDEHYGAVKKSIEKRRNIERIKSNTGQVVSERVEMALDELEEAKKLEEQLSQKATLISNNLRPALRQHSKQLHDDLLFSLLENARTQLIYESSILKDFNKLKTNLDSIRLKPLEISYTNNQVGGNSENLPTIERYKEQQEESMIRKDLVKHQRNGSGQQATRINQMAKSVRMMKKGDEDLRSKVDAKSAAASLARLF